MNKKLMAVAVAGALAAPATVLAQVQIYGRANLGFDRYEATGATAATSDLKARNRVFDSSSRLGFRGTEDLGGGIRALFVIETGVNIDTGTGNGQNGLPNTSANGALASRDSYVGLESSGGRVSFGRQSVFWSNGTIAQSGANYINIDVPMATVGGGFGRVAGIGTRINNTVMYTSPTINGFGGYVSYSPQSEAQQGSATIPTGQNGTNTNAVVEGLRVTYEGIVKGQLDWAVNKTQSGNAILSPLKTTGVKLGVGYAYAPGAQISVIVGQNENANIPVAVAGYVAAGDTVKQKAVVVNWEHTFGNIQALAMYGKLNKATGCTVAGGCDNTEATSIMAGGRYIFSKRTATYLTYNRTTNKDNQCLDYTAASYTSAASAATGSIGTCGTGGAAGPLAAGADPKIIALGVIHNF